MGYRRSKCFADLQARSRVCGHAKGGGFDFKKQDRQRFLILFFYCSFILVSQCIARAKSRKNHATLSPENAEAAIEMFAKGFKPPHESELGKMGKFELAETIVDAESEKLVLEKMIAMLK